MFSFHPGNKRLEIGSARAAHKKPMEIADVSQHGQVSGSLLPTAKNTERLCIATRQKIGSYGGSSCCALVGEIVGFHHRQGFAGTRIQQRVGGVDSCFRADTNNLYARSV